LATDIMNIYDVYAVGGLVGHVTCMCVYRGSVAETDDSDVTDAA